MAYQRIIDTLMIVLDRLTNCSIHKELPIQYDMQLSVETDERVAGGGLIVLDTGLPTYVPSRCSGTKGGRGMV